MGLIFSAAVAARLKQIEKELQAGFARLEGVLTTMPTRQEFDAAKAQLLQAISDAAARVATDIQALKDALASGNPVTQQDLTDLQTDVQALGAIDPPVTP